MERNNFATVIQTQKVNWLETLLSKKGIISSNNRWFLFFVDFHQRERISLCFLIFFLLFCRIFLEVVARSSNEINYKSPSIHFPGYRLSKTTEIPRNHDENRISCGSFSVNHSAKSGKSPPDLSKISFFGTDGDKRDTLKGNLPVTAGFLRYVVWQAL